MDVGYITRSKCERIPDTIAVKLDYNYSKTDYQGISNIQDKMRISCHFFVKYKQPPTFYGVYGNPS